MTTAAYVSSLTVRIVFLCPPRALRERVTAFRRYLQDFISLPYKEHRSCHTPVPTVTITARCRKAKPGSAASAHCSFLTSLALDPIEKKPLNRFYPGTTILSLGSYGCNLRCPFCQNFSISQNGRDAFQPVIARPEQIAAKALELKNRNNIGVAFTYNEPLLSWEFIRDTGELVHRNGQKNVVVTNGNFSVEIAKNLAGIVDAYNIDLKGFTLIVPKENDSPEEMEAIAQWIASLSPDIPLHVSKFFPRWNMVDRNETPAARVYRLADVARNYLKYVFTGNC